MGKIRIETTTHAPVDRVYSVARTFYKLIEYLPNIKDIVVLEESRDGAYSKAEWILDIKLPIPHGKLSWPQEMFWDDVSTFGRFRISPEYDGVVKRFDGTMLCRPWLNGTKLLMDLEFIVVHPMVTPTVQRIFDGIMKKNNESLLRGIKKRAERL
jgi:hypothetical protein